MNPMFFFAISPGGVAVAVLATIAKVVYDHRDEIKTFLKKTAKEETVLEREMRLTEELNGPNKE